MKQNEIEEKLQEIRHKEDEVHHAQNFFLLLGALNGLIAVALGAFGAHFLQERLSLEKMQVFDTASHYQLLHAIAIIAIASLFPHLNSPFLLMAAWMFVGGILIFSGSLYIIALTDITSLGAITPFGGVSLLLGWLLLMFPKLFDKKQ